MVRVSCIVHDMNVKDEKTLDAYRSLQLLSEITGDDPLSQRELSRRLGVAVGLVNSYLKNLVAKGYVRIKAFPKNRYSYLLTPQGLAEKSRLAYQHLSYFTNLYTVARQDYLEMFRQLEQSGIRKVVFCGVDEVAEIAYLSLQETSLELAQVVDSDMAGTQFFGQAIQSIDQVANTALPVIVTSLKRATVLREELGRHGLAEDMIYTVSV